MLNLRCGLAAAALLSFLASGPASGQNLIVGESADPAFLNGLPTPAIAEVFVGPLLGQFPNVRVTGSAVPFAADDFPFESDRSVPFMLEVIPLQGQGALVRFMVDGTVVETVSPAAAANAIFESDAIFVLATSGAPGLIARATNLRLEVPTGSAGGIASIAEANGGSRTFSILSLGCVSYALGFKLSGRFSFVGTAGAPITEFPASVQIRVSETGEDCTVDSDFDGIRNDFPDNCPINPNTDQSDIDGDGLGDVCDECPNEAEPSEDLDGDGVGFLCDNCPQGCLVTQQQEDASCANESQADNDGDGFGNPCDNCPEIFNEPVCCAVTDPLNPFLCVPTDPEVSCSSDADCDGIGAGVCRQADTDGDSEGNACEFPGITARAEDPGAATAAFLGPVTSTNGGAGYTLDIKCGPDEDLTTTNIPFRVPPAVTAVEFETCDQPPNPGDPTNPSDPAEQIRLCRPFPAEIAVDHTRSYTRGINITSPDLGVDGDRIFVVTLTGSLETAPGVFNGLCLKEDGQSEDGNIRNRPLGRVFFTGLDLADADQPSIVTDKLNFFEQEAEPTDGLGLGRCVVPTTPEPDPDRICTLVSSGGEPVATNLTTTSFNTGSGVNIEVRPAFDTVIGERIEKFQVSLLSDDVVKTVAIGLEGFGGMTMSDATYGGCGLGDTLDPPRSYEVFGCDTLNQGNVDFGPSLSGGPAFIAGRPPLSYVVYPGTANAPAELQSDTVYAVFQSISGINVPGQRTLLGIFEYAEGLPESLELPQPVVTTVGVTSLPNPDPLVYDDTTMTLPNMPQAVIFLAGGGAPSVDSVGGAGSTLNSDGDTLPDPLDNCRNVTNQAQLDDGRFLGVEADKIGNVCQCGDGSVNNDGAIFPQDLEECTDLLASGDTSSENARRCSVSQDGAFDIGDLTTLELALEEDGICRVPTAGGPPGSPVSCKSDDDCSEENTGFPDLKCLDKVRVQQVCSQAGE
ncbi:MAG: thrombospondin type 3 repeat-containing protein [Myxococcota bacterium]|nr:thrombospondin type 3 repeat-containing protein [Myxococcota bacterium]